MMREPTCLINERALAARSPITTPHQDCPVPILHISHFYKHFYSLPHSSTQSFLTLDKPIMRDIFMHPSKEIKSKIPKVA